MDREKVVKEIEDALSGNLAKVGHVYKLSLNGLKDKALADALSLLKEQEVVSAYWADDTGHWIEGDRDGIDPHTRTTGEMIDTFRCSWCGFYQYWKTPFCPNCGAKMKGR